MKKISFWILILLFLSFPIFGKAEEKEIDLYLFYGEGCPHCKEEKKWLETIKNKYNIDFHYFEVWYDKEGQNALAQAEKLLESNATGIPYTVIMDRKFTGFSSTTKHDIESAIQYCLKNACTNPLASLVGKETDKGPIKEEVSGIIDLPLLGVVDTKDVSLPITAIILGAIDGFNPCAMWILLFLIGMLLTMENKKRRWILGLTFLITSAIVYTMFMVAWLKITSFIGMTKWLRLLIAIIALIGGIINIKSYFSKKENGCEVVDEKKRKTIFKKIRNITSEKRFYLAFFGIIFLAASVNLIELLCSAGLPLTFTQILAMNELSSLEYACYIFLYMLFFLLDDIVIFLIGMTTLEVAGYSTKYGKLTHILGGILMILIGILMILKPEWLMFSF